MKITLIGGSGFIGTRLAELLEADGKDFTILDKVHSIKFPEKSILIDIRNKEDLLRELLGTGIIINLAAEHRDDVSPISLYEEVNVIGSENICQAASELEINNIIFTSSVAIYGYAPAGADENTSCKPFNEYGRTKLKAEKIFQSWASKQPSRRLAIVRPTVVFGEGNRGNFYNLINQIAGKKFLFIGNGQNHKALAYVGNVAAYLKYLTDNPEIAGIWNFVDTPISDMNQLVTFIRKKLGLGKGTGVKVPRGIGILGGIFFDVLAFVIRKNLPISRIRIKKFMADSSFSAAMVEKTGFIRPFALEAALDQVLEYEFPDLYNKTTN